MMKVACVQCNVAFEEPATNALALVEKLRQLAGQGVELAIFPEAYLTGYCVETREEAERIAISVEHDCFGLIADAVRDTYVTAVFGFIGKEGDELFNGAMVLAPKTRPYLYKKAHLPELGVDKFVEPGDELKVVEIPGRDGPVKLGVLICFDSRFPEATRVLALEGADIVALPTNWPVGAECSAEHICIARAGENRIYYATCNRVGEENGFTFIGLSKIIDPIGRVLASSGADETVLIAEIDPEMARNKRTVNIPGKYETTVFESRRPELYGPITG